MNNSAIEFLPSILRGAIVTVELTLFGSILALILATLAGLGRLSQKFAIRGLATIYIEFFRGTSIFVQLFWAYFVLPLFGLTLTSLQAGIVILGMNVGAYAAEVVRGAILAIPREQFEACVALNLTRWQRMRHVILPQAVIIMLPSFGNNTIELLKGTAVVSLISLPDMTFNAQVLRLQTGNTAVPFLTILTVYFLLALTISTTFRRVEVRLSKHLSKSGSWRGPQ